MNHVESGLHICRSRSLNSAADVGALTIVQFVTCVSFVARFASNIPTVRQTEDNAVPCLAAGATCRKISTICCGQSRIVDIIGLFNMRPILSYCLAQIMFVREFRLTNTPCWATSQLLCVSGALIRGPAEFFSRNHSKGMRCGRGWKRSRKLHGFRGTFAARA